MHKNKKIIFSLLMICLIIVIFIIFVNKDDNTNDSNDTELRESDIELINSQNNKLQKIDSYVTLNLIKNCVQKFYLNYIGISDPDNTNDLIEYYKEISYSMLSPNYIDSVGITQGELNSNIEYISRFNIELYDIYSLSKYNENPSDYDSITSYFVKGVIRDLDSYSGIEFNMILNLDNINNTFEVYLDNYLANVDFNNLKEGEEINFEIPNSVENRNYNKFNIISTNIEDIADYRFNNVKTLLLYDIDRAYKCLNEQLKSEKFRTIDDFRNFIDTNKNNMYFMTYSNYEIRYEDDIMVLDCYDKNDMFCISIYCNNYSELNYSISLL